LFDLQRLAAIIPGQWERVIATVLLLAAGFVVSHLWARYLGRGDVPAERRRLHLVWARNIIWSIVLFTIASVWASTIAGFALSLAAVAGAMLIVSKELLLCVLGYLYLTFVRPFKIGDLIEIGSVHGRVIDVDMLATTLAEHGDTGLPTGKTAAFPNALLLTLPLKNTSSTGDFVLHFLRIPVPLAYAHDLARIEAAATQAAIEATKAWQAQAEAHFRQVADESFVELPSGRIRVFWDFADPERLLLCVRLACPEKMRLQVGQDIFRATWQALPAHEPAQPRGPS
jgi:small-conductance mechanosensitive channel